MWRERGFRNNGTFAQDCGLCWYLDGLTDLHILLSGALTGCRYRDEILSNKKVFAILNFFEKPFISIIYLFIY